MWVFNLPEAIWDLDHFKSTYNGLVDVNGRFNINNETMGNICSLTRLLAGQHGSHHHGGVQSTAARGEPAKAWVALNHFLQ